MFGHCCICDKSFGRHRDVPKHKKYNTRAEVHTKKKVAIHDSSDDEIALAAVINQPKCTVELEPTQIRRPSVVSDMKAELSDEDDEVFYPTKMVKPRAKSPVPRWFSQGENRGHAVQVTPRTPVGRDEVILRRERLLNRLIDDEGDAAQNATEHKVRFDPLGPVIAGGEQPLPQCSLYCFFCVFTITRLEQMLYCNCDFFVLFVFLGNRVI